VKRRDIENSINGIKKMESIKAQRRQVLYNLLGELPPLSRKISSKVISRNEKECFILEELVLDLNGIEDVPAYFVKPKGIKKRYPVILYNHAHGGNYEIGKEELLKGHKNLLQRPYYAEELTRNGYSSLCIDAWSFGKRRNHSESEIYKHMIWVGQVMWGMMVYDSLRAIDYLLSRDDVDSTRIGTLGLSMGSTMAWWTAALDTRIKVCVDICCLTDFQSLINSNGLDLHGIYYYVPELLKHFDTAQINSLIAPRPHLSLAGEYDPLTPLEGLKKIDRILKSIYKKEKAEDAWVLKLQKTGHIETADMRKDILSFLRKWL